MTAFESISTWRRELPPPISATRTALVDEVATLIDDLGPDRLRIAVDGYTAAGKTSFGHELATAVRGLGTGRSTLRASFDDFKHPWRHSIEHGYDRTSGEGYFRNAPDFHSARELLLRPAGPDGSGVVVLCAHDPLTGVDHRATTVTAPGDAVLIVDSVFAFRPEYDEFWDLRIWLDVSPELSLRRGIDRDGDREGRAEAERLHRDRYGVAEALYIDEVDPRRRADLVIDNTVLAAPRIVRRGSASAGPG
ncbi:MAG: uridine kinase [Actinomycetota bacterium]